MDATCPDGSSCVARCSEILTCSGHWTTFTGHWTIDCRGTSACQDFKGICSYGENCTVICGGESACQGAVFSGDWTVECSGISACQGQQGTTINFLNTGKMKCLKHSKPQVVVIK